MGYPYPYYGLYPLLHRDGPQPDEDDQAQANNKDVISTGSVVGEEPEDLEPTKDDAATETGPLAQPGVPATAEPAISGARPPEEAGGPREGEPSTLPGPGAGYPSVAGADPKVPAGPELSRTSAKKVAANRANAQHSTGPRTKRGKDRSKFNALKHGLYAKKATWVTGGILTDDPKAAARFVKSFGRSLDVHGAAEEAIAAAAAHGLRALSYIDQLQATLLSHAGDVGLDDPRLMGSKPFQTKIFQCAHALGQLIGEDRFLMDLPLHARHAL